MEAIRIAGEPALLLPDATLVVADLHLGFENELRSRGINVPLKTDELIGRMKNLIRSVKPRNLVIVGDVKHHVAGPERMEFLAVPKFLSAIGGEASDVHIVLGNHDGGLEPLTPRDVEIHGSAGVAWGDAWLTHGSAKLPEEASSSRLIVMGHVHPSVRLRDAMGYRYSFQVWLSGPMKGRNKRSIVVLPSFNKYIGQLVMNEPTRATLRGPLLSQRLVELGELEVHTLEGHLLGKLRELF